jgi:hypothetical protein
MTAEEEMAIICVDPTETEASVITLGIKGGGSSSENHVLLSILSDFSDIFAEPYGLPLKRSRDHKIQISSKSGPINVGPYRYTHYQKNEIEKMVTGLLQSGVIRPSMSPYSLSILLVKKHDGSWRLCVNYRALNDMIVKDKFPILVIDKLLDELNGAHIFSKLNL